MRRFELQSAEGSGVSPIMGAEWKNLLKTLGTGVRQRLTGHPQLGSHDAKRLADSRARFPGPRVAIRVMELQSGRRSATDTVVFYHGGKTHIGIMGTG